MMKLSIWHGILSFFHSSQSIDILRSNSIFSLAPLVNLQRRLSRVGNVSEDGKEIGMINKDIIDIFIKILSESRRDSRKISSSNPNSVIHSPLPRQNSTATHVKIQDKTDLNLQ